MAKFEYDYYSGKLLFEGEYYDNKRHGKGKEFDFYTGKLIFEGEFRDGKKWIGKGYNENNQVEYEIKNGNGPIPT